MTNVVKLNTTIAITRGGTQSIDLDNNDYDMEDTVHVWYKPNNDIDNNMIYRTTYVSFQFEPLMAHRERRIAVSDYPVTSTTDSTVARIGNITVSTAGANSVMTLPISGAEGTRLTGGETQLLYVRFMDDILYMNFLRDNVLTADIISPEGRNAININFDDITLDSSDGNQQLVTAITNTGAPEAVRTTTLPLAVARNTGFELLLEAQQLYLTELFIQQMILLIVFKLVNF